MHPDILGVTAVSLAHTLHTHTRTHTHTHTQSIGLFDTPMGGVSASSSGYSNAVASAPSNAVFLGAHTHNPRPSSFQFAPRPASAATHSETTEPAAVAVAGGGGAAAGGGGSEGDARMHLLMETAPSCLHAHANFRSNSDPAVGVQTTTQSMPSASLSGNDLLGRSAHEVHAVSSSASDVHDARAVSGTRAVPEVPDGPFLSAIVRDPQNNEATKVREACSALL